MEAIGDRTMTIFAAVFIGIFLIVVGALIWKKLRVVDGRLALMQNGIKELHIMESRLFNTFMLNAASFNTSAPAAPVTKPVGLAGHLEVGGRQRRAALDEHIAELYAKHDDASPHVGSR
jgi:hypothetical protein